MTLAFSRNSSLETPALVLIHAFPLNSKMWKHQLNGLDDTIQVIAPDMPGFGESEPFTEVPSMGAYVRSLLSFLDTQNIKQAIFAGCSMGGYILFELWRVAPERVRGLILCDTRAEADAPEMREVRMKTIEQVLQNGPAELAEAMLPKLVSSSTLEKRPDLMEKLKQFIINNPNQGIAHALQALADRPDSSNDLPTINVPVLILVGEDDQLTPPDLAKSMHNKIPGSRLGIIKNAGHLSPLEQPERANTVIRTFLMESGLIFGDA